MDLQELKQFILNKYPKSRKNLNGTRCANTISIEQVLFEIGQFERLCEGKESSDELGNCIKPAVSNSALKDNNKLIENMCLSYRHDFGLIDKEQQDKLRFECKEWLQAYENNREHCC